jgi:hypothetical protein
LKGAAPAAPQAAEKRNDWELSWPFSFSLPTRKHQWGKEKPHQACGCPAVSLLCRLAGLLLGMLVFVDALADPVLLTIDPFLLGLGQTAVVLRHVLLFTVLHTGLALLEVSRLLLHSCPPPLLLMSILTLVLPLIAPTKLPAPHKKKEATLISQRGLCCYCPGARPYAAATFSSAATV